jgi:hypothetical protein
MRRTRFIFAIAALAFGLTAATALAANVHFKHGSPVFSDQGLSLNASGSLTGLGNGDVVITVTVNNAQPVATCTNPSGKTQPPGQNPARATLTGVEALPGSDIKNGNLAFSVSTGTPVTPIPGAPDCPGSNWTEDVTDVIFFGLTNPAATATITVYQPCTDTEPPISCTVVLTQTFPL